jgi:RNA polymerase sigma-70 factor (ECF subfamily)
MINEEKFITLFVEHESELRAFAFSLTLQREDAMDVIQEACIAMWRKIQTLESERSFRSWAFSYVRMTALNQRRKKQRSALRFTDQMIEIMAAEWEDESDLVRAERKALAECLDKLPEKQQRLIGLYYESPETTVGDLAKRLNQPLEGVYKALQRCRVTLRQCIANKLQTRKTS